MSIQSAIDAIEFFQGDSLTKKLAEIESEIIDMGKAEISDFCDAKMINETFLDSALAIKKLAGLINMIIHSAGILHSLKSILLPDEMIESTSLGAGNTGRKFDLETNFRVAEYKFIDWQGGPESIRQNSIFKDFFELAEFNTTKKKYLYVVGSQHPLKFLNGNRSLRSVLSKQPTIFNKIKDKYGEQINVVSDYYFLKKDEVIIFDISPYIGRSLVTNLI